MRKLLTVLLAAVIILSGMAPARASTLKRGSKGDSVKNIQEELIELGYLDDTADGVFGKKTEAAVKAFQKSLKVKATGKLTDKQQDELLLLWGDALGFMSGDGLDEDELKEIYPDGCTWKKPEEGDADFCWRHFEAGYLTKRMYMPGLPDKATLMLGAQAEPMWEQAIQDLYAEWAKSDRKTAREQLKLYEQGLEDEKTELKERYGEESAHYIQRLVFWLEEECVDRCFDLHTAEGNE